MSIKGRKITCPHCGEQFLSPLADRRKDLRLSIRDICGITGLSPQTVFNWEMGTMPNTKNIKAAAAAYQMSVADFVHAVVTSFGMFGGR